MSANFLAAIADLNQVNEAFKAGTVSSVEHGYRRGVALCSAIFEMAACMGASLEKPISIDSRGEIHVVTKGKSHWDRGSGRYGEEFASWLNKANPRTGIAPGAVMLPEAGWCYLNHFNVEKLVLEYASTLAKVA